MNATKVWSDHIHHMIATLADYTLYHQESKLIAEATAFLLAANACFSAGMRFSSVMLSGVATLVGALPLAGPPLSGMAGRYLPTSVRTYVRFT
jgi:hypothetical protein